MNTHEIAECPLVAVTGSDTVEKLCSSIQWLPVKARNVPCLVYTLRVRRFVNFQRRMLKNMQKIFFSVNRNFFEPWLWNRQNFRISMDRRTREHRDASVRRTERVRERERTTQSKRSLAPCGAETQLNQRRSWPTRTARRRWLSVEVLSRPVNL